MSWKTLVKIIEDKTTFSFRLRTKEINSHGVDRFLSFNDDKKQLYIIIDESKYAMGGANGLTLLIKNMDSAWQYIYKTRGESKKEIYQTFLNDWQTGNIPELKYEQD